MESNKSIRDYFNLKEKDNSNYDSEKIIKLNDKLVIQNSGYIDGMNQEDIRISQINNEKMYTFPVLVSINKEKNNAGF